MQIPEDGQVSRPGGATHLIKVAVEAVLGRRSDVAIFGTDYDTPDGTGIRDYIHVSDLASAHLLALEALIKKPATSFTVNCGYGRGYSVQDVLNAVDRVAEKSVKRWAAPRRPGDPACLVASNFSIRSTLPWEPIYDEIDIIVRDALAWEQQLVSIRSSDDSIWESALLSER